MQLVLFPLSYGTIAMLSCFKGLDTVWCTNFKALSIINNMNVGQTTIIKGLKNPKDEKL